MRRLFSLVLLACAAAIITTGLRAQVAGEDPRVRLREGVSRDALDEQGKRTYDAVVNPTTPYGRGLPRPIGMWMHSPRLGGHILPLYMYLRFGGDSWDAKRFDVRQVEIAILTAARHIDSQYQWTSHEPTALKVGVEPELLATIKQVRSLDEPVSGLGEKEKLIIRIGREMFGDRRIAPETFNAAVETFGRDGYADLTALLAFYEFLLLSSNATFDLQSEAKPLLSPRPQPFSSVRVPSTGGGAAGAPRAALPTNADASLPQHVAMWLHSPELAELAVPAYRYLHEQNQLGPRPTALAILVAARQINSQYQWTVHEPAALKAGVEPAVIDAIKQRRTDGLAEPDALIARFGRELFNDRRVSAATFAAAMKTFGLQGVTDLAALMAFQEFVLYSSIAAFDLRLPPGQQPLLPST